MSAAMALRPFHCLFTRSVRVVMDGFRRSVHVRLEAALVFKLDRGQALDKGSNRAIGSVGRLKWRHWRMQRPTLWLLSVRIYSMAWEGE